MSEDSQGEMAAVAHIMDRVLALGMFVQLDRLFTALFGMPADVLTEIRVNRLERIQEMRAKKAALLGVTEHKALPEKVAQEVITGAAVEEDEDMQELWANLLANHDAGRPISTFLVHLLKNLDGRTAKVLLFFWDRVEAVRPKVEKERDWGGRIIASREALASDVDLHRGLGDWAPAERVRLQAMGLIAAAPTGTEETYFGLEEIGHMLCQALTGPKS